MMKRFLIAMAIIPLVAVCAANAAAKKKEPHFDADKALTSMATFAKVFTAPDSDSLETDITKYAFEKNLEIVTASIAVAGDKDLRVLQYSAIVTFRRK